MFLRWSNFFSCSLLSTTMILVNVDERLNNCHIRRWTYTLSSVSPPFDLRKTRLNTKETNQLAMNTDSLFFSFQILSYAQRRDFFVRPHSDSSLISRSACRWKNFWSSSCGIRWHAKRQHAVDCSLVEQQLNRKWRSSASARSSPRSPMPFSKGFSSYIHIHRSLKAVAYLGFFEHWADSQQNFPGYWAIEANQKPTGP